MNIFLGVYACEPNIGSEPEVGWQMVNSIAKVMPNDQIYALTKLNNKKVIEKEGYPSNVKFFYYAPPKWLTFWKKGARGIRTYYYIWLIGAALYMKKQKINFDIIHHITFVNDWLPSFFHLLKTKQNKFIWGPIGSHDSIQVKFLNGAKRKSIEKIRIFLQLFFRNLDPSFYICKNKADCIIGINNNVKKKLNIKNDKFFIAEPAIGIKKSILKSMSNMKKDDKIFTIISVGRLLYFKNFQLTIKSFAEFLYQNPDITNVRLKIIGEGEDRESLEKLSIDLNIEKYVEFTGNISLSNVHKEFSKANLFLFPTLENAGFVTLEAMSNSLPVLAMKYGGPEQFVKNNTYEQLVSSSEDYETIIINFAKKIDFFYKNKEDSIRIGEKNKQDLLDSFTWEAKAQKMKKIYMEILDEA